MTLNLLQRPQSAADSPPADAPADRLASHGELLALWLARSDRIPTRWRSTGFTRIVDLVRTHLRPIHDRHVLARSYTREHFHVIAVGRPLAAEVLLERDATEVAYALRWLELGGFRGGPWSSLVDSGTVPDREC
jgi:hypothetical protein